MEGDYADSEYQPSSSGEFGLYTYYHNEKWLRPQLENAGFELVKLFRQEQTLGNGWEVTDLAIVAQKR